MEKKEIEFLSGGKIERVEIVPGALVFEVRKGEETYKVFAGNVQPETWTFEVKDKKGNVVLRHEEPFY